MRNGEEVIVRSSRRVNCGRRTRIRAGRRARDRQRSCFRRPVGWPGSRRSARGWAGLVGVSMPHPVEEAQASICDGEPRWPDVIVARPAPNTGCAPGADVDRPSGVPPVRINEIDQEPPVRLAAIWFPRVSHPAAPVALRAYPANSCSAARRGGAWSGFKSGTAYPQFNRREPRTWHAWYPLSVP